MYITEQVEYYMLDINIY